MASPLTVEETDARAGVDRLVIVLPKVGTRVIVIKDVTCDKMISDELRVGMRLLDTVVRVGGLKEVVVMSKPNDGEDEISAPLLLVVVDRSKVATPVVSSMSSRVDVEELVVLPGIVSGAGIPTVVGPLGRDDEGNAKLDATMLALPTNVDRDEVESMLLPPKTAEGDCKLRMLVVV